MKSINEYINEQQEIDESVEYALGTLFSEAVFIAGTFICYKTLKALIKGAIAVFNNVSIKDELKKLDEIKNKMAKLLSKYPDDIKKIKEVCKKHLANIKDKAENILSFDNEEFLSKNLGFFEDADKEEFIQLYKSSQEIKEKTLNSLVEVEMK